MGEARSGSGIGGRSSDAALALVEAGDGARFTADELAVRAGVSQAHGVQPFRLAGRRAAGRVHRDPGRGRRAGSAVPGPGERRGRGGRASMFAALAQALRAADLSAPILRVWRALGGPLVDEQRTGAFAQQALALVAEEPPPRSPGTTPTRPARRGAAGEPAHAWVGSDRGAVGRVGCPGPPAGPRGLGHLLERLLDTVGRLRAARRGAGPGPPTPHHQSEEGNDRG